ncbi:hypothetical protein R1flu_026221 [Riccia fluitans]|uniref:Uncharacterized protein n=1 Tax=Riccia fluitans TaxID=41844 RepID=A0ABD1XJD8_9MARC
MFNSLWTLEDILRKSQKECDILEKEMDKMVTTFSKHKRVKSLASDSIAQDQPKLIEKLKAVTEKVMMKEAAQQQSRKEWLKQRDILVNRRNEMKFEDSKRLEQLEGEVKKRDDNLRRCKEKLHTESVRRRYSEANVASLKEEIQYLKVAMNEKSAEIEKTQKERDEGLQEANFLKQKIDQVTSEVQMKDVDLTVAVNEINLLKVTVETLSGRLQCQNGFLKDKDEQIGTLRKQIAKWIQENSALELEKAALYTEKQRIEVENTNLVKVKQEMEESLKELICKLSILKDKDEQVCTLREEIAKWLQENSALELDKEALRKEKQRTQVENTTLLKQKEETEESLIELKCKLNISKERVSKSEELLRLKEQEIISLRGKVNAEEKKLEECKRSREMAFEMVKKQKCIQDSYKRQTAYLKEECEKHLKRHSRLLKQVEEERDKVEEGHFNQEHEGIWLIGETSETQTVEDMKDQLTKLRTETKEVLASSVDRLTNILNSHSSTGIMKSFGEKSSTSSAG